MKRAIGLISVILMFLIVACTNPAPFQSPPIAPTFNSPLAAPTLSNPVEATQLPMGPAFAFIEPVKAGDTAIAGTGGANVPIRIISISDAGEVVASGQVGADGKFSFSPNIQLTKGTRLGIILGEVAGTGFKTEDFIRGPNYSDLPYVGIVFAQTLVQ